MTTRDPVSSSSDSSSVPSARTVMRQLIKIEIPPAQFGESSRIGYLASEVDPLLTSLAAQDEEIAKLKADVTWWQTSRENLAEALSETIDEHAEMQQTVIANRIKIDSISAALAEREQEIERFKVELLIKREEVAFYQNTTVGELRVQLSALTARAEAAEADLQTAKEEITRLAR